MKVKALLLILCLGLSLTPFSAAIADDPDQWLERMGSAMSQMNYQGTFVYVLDDRVETVRITHMVDEKGSHERLVSVSGMPREVLRDSDGARWLSGDDREVLANASSSRSFFPELPLVNTSEAVDSYSIQLSSRQRIAGHSGRQLDIVPRDQFRYGYRLWLETESGLLLKWELTGVNGETLAKLMFTELKMGSQVDPAELQSVKADPIEQASKETPKKYESASWSSTTWKASKLPPGFRLASHRSQASADQAFYEHLVYSDGIATVSIYIEPTENSPEMETGLSQWGTTHAFIREVDGKVVTVLGDVPAATVKLIADSVNPVAP